MKHVLWMALLPGLLLAAGDQARQADADGAAIVPPASVSLVTSPPVGCRAIDQPYKESLTSLARERQDFVAAFDWNQPGDQVELARRYGTSMEAFRLRELELKRDWYQATGQAELLQGTQAALERMTSPPRVLPDLDPEHRQAAPTGQEVTR